MAANLRKKHRKSRQMQIQSLEDRQMMAADSYVTNDVLYVVGTNSSDTAYVDNAGSKVNVKLNGKTESFTKTRFSMIKFYGYKGNDYFRNNTDIQSKAYGHEGNDTLIGGSNRDELYGGSNNDNLYGENGVDYLSGGSGNDGLYGGGNNSKDTLNGGSGSDRFITQSGDTINDLRSEDVRIIFSDSGIDWKNSEIRTADKAFRSLHMKTDGTKILKDPWTNKPLVFVKHSDSYMDKNYPTGNKNTQTDGANVTTDNSYTYKTWNYVKFKWDHHHVTRRSREIIIRDWNAAKSSENSEAVDTILHEIGHNFDNSESGEGHRQWSSFQSLHDKNKSSASFVSGYAKTNVKEDWASTFAYYVDHGTSSSNSVVRAKLKLVDQFFSSMA